MEIKYLLLNEKYINYWDTWHWHWYLQAKAWLSKGHTPEPDDYFSWLSPRFVTVYTNDPLTALWEMQDQHKLKNGWRVPFRGDKPAIGKDETECWKFFPIPYWGDPDNSLLKVAFLSLNHQHPIDEQNIIQGTYKKLYDAYHQTNNSYHETVKSLLHDPAYTSNKKYQAQNLEFASSIIRLLDAKNEVKPEDIIQFFLVPWLTDSTKEITTTYIQENAALIFNKVLEPVAKMSAELVSSLRGVVLMRWNNLHKIDFPQLKVYHFSEQVPEEKVILDELNSSQNGWGVSYFRINKATFINFSFHGGNSYPTNIKGVIDTISYAKLKG